MTKDRTLTLLSNKIIPISLVLAGSVVLASCSSKPSPWAEPASPWESRSEQAVEPEPLMVEDINPEPIEETIEPVGYVAAEDDTSMVESEGMIESPIVDESIIEEPIVDEEPVLEESVVITGGNLNEQPAGMYAVQVVASSSMDQLNFFAQQNQISADWIAETTVDGKVWFVLMSGLYATKEEAEQAMTELQELGTEPWIRTVGSIQSAMNQ